MRYGIYMNTNIGNYIWQRKTTRAVGGACNRNPVMLIVPCHRVIGGSGKPVGFDGGLLMKEALLRLEASEER